MATIQKDRILQFRGQDLCDRDGSKIGSIEEIYLDTQTGEPEWALVHTGLFGSKHTFVPLRDASEGDGTLQVPFEKSQVKDAPKTDPDGQLSQREESDLYRHYGMEYSESQSDTGLGEGTTGTTGTTSDRDWSDDDSSRRGVAGTTDDTGRTSWGDDDSGTRGESFGGAPAVGEDTSGPTTDNAMTRSEEELAVGTREREAGRARLRKYVVTDEVEQTVPVKREEIRVEREPITDANIDDATSGPELSEEEHVRLDKDVETEERTVSESVAREEIDVDGDADRRDR
jgi:hypothetical protein